MKLHKRLNGSFVDVAFLTIVKVVTSLLGLVSTRIISDGFSFHLYGTYSQSMLLNTTISAIIILGLTDAVNLYFNRFRDNKDFQQKYISNIFSLQIIIGVVASVVVIISKNIWISYFDNEELAPLIKWVAAMPMLSNILSMQQVLFVSIGEVKIIAIRNLLVSVLRLIIFCIACYLTKNIETILILQLVCDLGQVLYFKHLLGKYGVKVELLIPQVKVIREVLIYSIPISAFVVTSSLLRDIDKYIVGFYTNSETLAIFSNASKILPLDMFVASLTTVLLPILTKSIVDDDKMKLRQIYNLYFSVSIMVGLLMVGAAVVSAPSLMAVLYGDKYVIGLDVFVVYLLVTLVRFVNLALLFNAAGKSLIILAISLGALLANVVLSICLFYCFGIVGCAIATLIISVVVNVLMMYKSKEILGTSAFNLIEWRTVGRVFVYALLIGFGSWWFCLFMENNHFSHFLSMMLTSVIYIGILIFFIKKKLMSDIRLLNKFKLK